MGQQQGITGSSVVLEAGELAPLADGAAMARDDGTSMLAAVVCEAPPQPLWRARLHNDFLEVCLVMPCCPVMSCRG